MRQCFSKKSINEIIKSFESFYNRQDKEELRALYGAGSFSVATEYEKFKLDSAQWHRWLMKKKQDHIKRFRNYKPNLTDAYKKPCNSERKPGAYTKSKRPNTEPDIVVDRLTSESLENSNSGELMVTLTRASSSEQWKAATNTQEELRFQDPREKRPKVFDLCLRQNSSSKISKCQDNCDRKIGSLKELFIIHPYGNTSWTDKVTMKERVKYGPQYIHFDEDCLKQYDTSEFYGPGNGFDFSRITVDRDVQNDLNDTAKKYLGNIGVTIM